MPYNYEHFRVREYDFGNFGGPRPGEPAVDFTAQTLDGKTVRLSDFFGMPVVLETGSLTCGVYLGKIESMSRLAARFVNTQFLVLYVREAHPGRRVPAHSATEQKCSNAQRVQREYDERRVILVDDLEGTAHERYGLAPDLTYILDRDGTVVYRAVWNDPKDVETVLTALEAGRTPPVQESHLFVWPSRFSFGQLAVGGVDALFDYAINLPQLILMHMKSNSSETNQTLREPESKSGS